MNYQQILCEVDGPVATITLNRPTRMNALTKVMETELRSAIEAVGRDSRVRAIVLVGAGKAFCAGMDMDELEVLPPEDIRAEEWMRPYDMNRRADYQTRYSYFPATPKPIISAVNGAAAGLGLIMGNVSQIVQALEAQHQHYRRRRNVLPPMPAHACRGRRHGDRTLACKAGPEGQAQSEPAGGGRGMKLAVKTAATGQHA
jgi:enoyl-CoA hydratase/carnithine racemase